MARPRKPTSLKVISGAFDKNPNRRNHAEPTPTGEPTCPAHLPALAVEEWERLTAELQELGVLSMVERSAMENYCRCYAEFREACKKLDTEGRYESTQYGLKEHPAGKAMRALALILHKYLCEFGMTPSSRTRLQVTKAAKVDDKEAKYLA
jgi:P27 family predicted phage terminase small subunit